MILYRCTNIGNCNLAGLNEIIESSSTNPACAECSSPLSVFRNSDSLSRYKKYTLKIIIFMGIIAIAIFVYYLLSTHDYRLTIEPPDNGVIMNKDRSLNCGNNCNKKYSEGTKVSLNFKEKKGFIFKEWKGDCTGTKVCNVILDGDKRVGAIFSAKPKQMGSQNKTINPDFNKESNDENIKEEFNDFLNKGLNYIGQSQNYTNKDQAYANAETQFKKAIEIGKDCGKNPETSFAYANLGSIYVEQEKYDLALEMYKRAEDCNSEDALLIYNISSYYLKINKDRLALKKLDESFKLGLRKEIKNRELSLCTIIRKDFKGFSLKKELELILERYEFPYCKGLI